MFIGSEIKTKALENSLTNRLMVERLKQRIDTIDCDINAKFTFYFPETVFFTAKGPRSQKIGDLSNLCQLVEDALTKSKVIKDDSFICSLDGSSRQPIQGNNYFLEIELTKI